MAEKRLKKVLFVITKGNFGGAQRYVFDLATNLPPEFEPVVVLGEGRGLKEKLDEASIRTISVPDLGRDMNFVKEFKSSLNLLKVVWQEKPDILHLNSPKAGGFGGVAGRLCGVKKIIFTAHGWAFNESRPFYQKILIKFFALCIILLSHKTIAVSEKTKRDVSSWPFMEKKIAVIRNGVSEIDFETRKETREFLYRNAPKGATWIGTLSELHHIKGLSYAIRAMRSVVQNHNAIFLILGAGEERKKLEDLIKSEGLEGRVILKGFVKDAPIYLKAFDIFILTSLSEAFPLALLEAGLAELAVVATTVGGIPELINHNETGVLVESKNIIEIYKSINELIENKKKREQLGHNLSERIKKEFSLKQMIEKTVSLYETKT